MYKFKPILKSMLWGGDKIIPYKRVESDQKQVGESWEISGVKDNESVVAEGPDAGMKLPELIARDKGALVGQSNYERFGKEFPLLIKFIDARQVQPQLAYASPMNTGFITPAEPSYTPDEP